MRKVCSSDLILITTAVHEKIAQARKTAEAFGVPLDSEAVRSAFFHFPSSVKHTHCCVRKIPCSFKDTTNNFCTIFKQYLKVQPKKIKLTQRVRDCICCTEAIQKIIDEAISKLK